MYGKKTVSLTGNDTLVVGGRVLTDVADGNWAELTYPNSLVEVKTGKGGNSIYAFNASGLMCELTVRVIRSSADDLYLNARLALMKQDFARFILMSGQLVKRVGNGFGLISLDTYLLDGGVFVTQPAASANAEGDTNQSVSVYRFRFTNADRAVF